MKVHVVQYEEGGIPQEPQLFVDIDDAADYYQQMAMDQGFRMRGLRDLNETFEQYRIDYWRAIDEEDTDQEQEAYPDFDRDDTVRYWEIEL